MARKDKTHAQRSQTCLWDAGRYSATAVWLVTKGALPGAPGHLLLTQATKDKACALSHRSPKGLRRKDTFTSIGCALSCNKFRLNDNFSQNRSIQPVSGEIRPSVSIR